MLYNANNSSKVVNWFNVSYLKTYLQIIYCGGFGGNKFQSFPMDMSLCNHWYILYHIKNMFALNTHSLRYTASCGICGQGRLFDRANISQIERDKINIDVRANHGRRKLLSDLMIRIYLHLDSYIIHITFSRLDEYVRCNNRVTEWTINNLCTRG